MRLKFLAAIVSCAAMSLPLAAVTASGASAAPAAPSVAADRMPGEVPSTSTPWVTDGQVNRIVQVGDLMIAAGKFTQVSDPMGGATLTRQNIFAFDAATGAVSNSFAPSVDGEVRQLLPGPTSDTVYVAGEFSKINGRGPNHVQLLNVHTGQALSSFNAPSTNGAIQAMQLLPGNRLFIGGSFTKVGGASYGQLISLNATTGALDPFMNLTATLRHNTSSGARGPIGPREATVTPAGDRMVVVGNFRNIGGQARDQIVMINLTGPTATVATNWYTTRYTPLCSNRAFDGYIRDVEMSPDGSFFIVSTTGGAHSGTLCDATARFETHAVGTTLQPTWVASSGGDTMWGVEVTRAAVFVGGHNRWLNNPGGSDRATQGAVPRPGLAALDPKSGIPLKWNPGRNPRGEAAYDVYETDAGIWVVSDTEWIGDRRYRRPRIAMFPYSEGYNLPSESTGSLPGNLYIGGDGGQARVVGFNGSTVTAQSTATTFDWSSVRGSVMIGRTLFYGATDGYLYRRSFDGTSFGAATRVNPYLDPAWNNVQTGSGQTYAGMLPTWYSQLGTVTGMFYSNGRIYYTRSGLNTLYWRAFSPDSGIVGATENTAPGGNISWFFSKGMFLDGQTLYVVNSLTGQLLKIGFNGGVPTGTSSVANSSIDWRGRSLFVAAVQPNQAPTAAFTANCTGLSCDFDASGSSDSDGSVASYAWSFTDGETAGGPTPTKTFAGTGSYPVTLTVTDDAGGSTTITQQVSVEKPNEPPAVAFATDCDFLECTFDASGTVDADGSVAAFAWDFGDGHLASGSTTTHTYDTPGEYTVTLTATDDDGASAQTTRTHIAVGAPAASTVSYVGGAVSQGNVATPNVTTPSTISAGDRLVLALSLNANDRELADPSGITDWTVLDTVTSGGMLTRVYTKLATAADADQRVTVSLNEPAKYTMTVAGYSGARAGTVVHASFAETIMRTDHATPTVQAPAGAWVVSYWADKSSATTGFALPGSITSRQTLCGTGPGRICSALADSGTAVPTGQYGDLVANSDSAQATATTWSIILRTVAPNQAPTAVFTQECSGAVCTFTANGSTDTDGNVASYAWDFGDGHTATGASVEHDFTTSGTREVTLTVTDDEGAEGSLAVPVSVTRTNGAPVAAFTTTCSFLSCTFDASAATDGDGELTSYSWDFGDGQTETSAEPITTHSYAAGGSRLVTLTVTDNDLGNASTSREVSPVAVAPIAFRGSKVNNGNVSTPNVNVPETASAGDRLVMVLSINDSTRQVGVPTSGVTGWTLLESETSGSMQTLVFTRVAAASDAGRTVRFTMDAAAKYTLTLAAYGGDSLAPQVSKASESTLGTDHVTPATTAGAGDWVVSYWADKSSTTTGFTLPAEITHREGACAPNAGRICSVLADSGAGVTAGSQGALTAVADAPSANATMWTIVIPRAG